MGKMASAGPFTPAVIVVRNIVGEKEFNKLRGKAISLHSQGELQLQSEPLYLLVLTCQY